MDATVISLFVNLIFFSYFLLPFNITQTIVFAVIVVALCVFGIIANSVVIVTVIKSSSLKYVICSSNLWTGCPKLSYTAHMLNNRKILFSLKFSEVLKIFLSSFALGVHYDVNKMHLKCYFIVNSTKIADS